MRLIPLQYRHGMLTCNSNKLPIVQPHVHFSMLTWYLASSSFGPITSTTLTSSAGGLIITPPFNLTLTTAFILCSTKQTPQSARHPNKKVHFFDKFGYQGWGRNMEVVDEGRNLPEGLKYGIRLSGSMKCTSNFWAKRSSCAHYCGGVTFGVSLRVFSTLF